MSNKNTDDKVSLETEAVIFRDYSFWICIGIFVLLVGIICLFPLFFTLPAVSDWLKFSNTGNIGDTIGGTMSPFIAIVGALLTFIAFWIQYKANQVQVRALAKQRDSDKEQKKQSVLQQFESNFFELVKLHRENVSELNYTKYDGSDFGTSVHRKVFRVIFSEFIECYKEIKKYSVSENPNDYILPSYKKRLTEIIESVNPEINIIELVIIDIAYNIVFYGINEESLPVVHSKFKERYQPRFIFPLLNFIKLKPKRENKQRWELWLEFREMKIIDLKRINQEIYDYRKGKPKIKSLAGLSSDAKRFAPESNFYKYYGGHQHRLGHYFRHLFQSFKYLNYNSDLTDSEKYFYGKTLRAQLSTYEQALIFINSISTLGMKWEYTPELELLSEKEDKNSSKLITRYNVIKNLPGEHFYGLRYKKYYPKVNYETDDI